VIAEVSSRENVALNDRSTFRVPSQQARRVSPMLLRPWTLSIQLISCCAGRGCGRSEKSLKVGLYNCGGSSSRMDSKSTFGCFCGAEGFPTKYSKRFVKKTPMILDNYTSYQPMGDNSKPRRIKHTQLEIAEQYRPKRNIELSKCIRFPKKRNTRTQETTNKQDCTRT
jgi:hypothetical protein